MKKCRLWTAAGVALMLAATSCADHDVVEDSGAQPQQGEPVEVGFSIKVGSLAAGDDATYSLFQTGGDALTRVIPEGIKDGADALVRNLWVIQFEDGITGDAAAKKMIGVPRFISGDDLDDASQSGTVQLIGTTNPCFIVWIANHPGGGDYRWNLPLNATFADVAAKMIQLTKEADTWPDIPVVGGDPTIMMNAITKTPVQPGSGNELTPVFSRNYAKVTLRLKIDSDDCRIKSVRLRNVPINVTLSELALGPDYTNAVPNNATIYPYGSPLMNYNLVEVSDLENIGSEKDFSWYVPRNQQGINITATDPRYNNKNYYAPMNATYFEVIAQRKSDGETAIFRVYPGANQVNDFTLLPNHAYTSSLNVVGIGDSYTIDSRVENFDDVGYTDNEAANCYILNPAPAGGRARKYSIPITNAIRYWSGDLKGYGNKPANVIKNGELWRASIVWSDYWDNDTNKMVTLEKDYGAGPGDKFVLSVPAGLPAYNFTVKITREDDQDTTLWSWHFWVTDYNPDTFNFDCIDRVTENPGGIPNGTFTYPVPNGQVERYAGAIWSTGAYIDKVMMDRPLGAVENYFTEQPKATTTRGHLYYQYGRKDPFPIGTANNAGIVSLAHGTIRYRLYADDDIATKVSIAQAVMNPNVFYNVYDNNSPVTWCNELGGSTVPYYVWFDPKAVTTDMKLGTDYIIKSIYDPCPPGWRLPVLGTWAGFALNVTTQHIARDLGYSGGRGVNAVNALRYWPGNADSPVGGTIYYATSGQRDFRSGNANSMGANGYYWTATTYNETSSYIFSFESAKINLESRPVHSYGNQVRCVSE